jgi:hypothetical protein
MSKTSAEQDVVGPFFGPSADVLIIPRLGSCV